MKITIENTTKIVEVNDVPARIWEGHTASGIAIHCYITRVAVANDADHTEFEKELQDCRAPSAAVAAIPMNLIL